jgi:thiol-disulfide isomerase/thioredoxin
MTQWLPISRRKMVAGVAGIAAGIGWPSFGGAQNFDNPPSFSTARHQFELLYPPATLPAVKLTGLDGRVAQVAPTPGKILLVNIWATWCALCRIDLPMLERFQDTAGTHVNVTAVSIGKDNPGQVRGYLNSLGIRHIKVLLDPEERLASKDFSGAVPLPVYSMPITFLVTPSGRIAGSISGAVDWLASDAQKLLAYYSQA